MNKHRVPLGSCYDWPTTRNTVAESSDTAEVTSFTAAYQKKLRNGEVVSAEEEDQYFDALRRSRHKAKLHASVATEQSEEEAAAEAPEEAAEEGDA